MLHSMQWRRPDLNWEPRAYEFQGWIAGEAFSWSDDQAVPCPFD
jgi:hypothetical protein